MFMIQGDMRRMSMMIKRNRDEKLNFIISEDANHKKPFKKRIVEPRSLYETSTWGKMLADQRTRDPSTKIGKSFRRRFRVPFPIFEEILRMTREKKWFSENPDCCGRAGAPLELKILGVLRLRTHCYAHFHTHTHCYNHCHTHCYTHCHTHIHCYIENTRCTSSSGQGLLLRWGRRIVLYKCRSTKTFLS